jgi:hypothetical protein
MLADRTVALEDEGDASAVYEFPAAASSFTCGVAFPGTAVR